jgi:hypothetical protein
MPIPLQQRLVKQMHCLEISPYLGRPVELHEVTHVLIAAAVVAEALWAEL